MNRKHPHSAPRGNGTDDDTAALQHLLDQRGRVGVPSGTYRLTDTLRIHSGTHLIAAPDARLISDGTVPKHRGDFLLTNADPENGNADIHITGGIWDGDNAGPCHRKDDDLFNPRAWSGTLINFFNVRRLALDDMTLANSTVYFTRFCRIDDFVIRDIRFDSPRLAYNQDGLHFGGFVRNGVIENIRAVSRGQTNDDLIALNADDSMIRLENHDLVCGPIENLAFKDLHAEDCHTAIRILSVTSPIRNIRIENVEAGCRCHAINMDAARYCRTPLFTETEHPDGVGWIENVAIHNLTVYATQPGGANAPLMTLETQANGFSLHGFVRDTTRDAAPDKPTLLARNLVNQRLRCDAHETVFTHKADRLAYSQPFSTLTLDRRA